MCVDQCVYVVRAVEVPAFVYLRSSRSHVTGVGGPYVSWLDMKVIVHNDEDFTDIILVYPCCLCISKSPQWPKLWLYSQCPKCFWKRFVAARPFWSEPSSDCAAPTAASKLSVHYRTRKRQWYLMIQQWRTHINTCMYNEHFCHRQLSVYWSEGQNVPLAFRQFWVRCFRRSYKSYCKH